MKRLSVLAAAILSFGILTASADNDTPITFEQLPKTAQTFITTHFPKHKVAYAKEERDLMKISYDVMFTDGTKLEFDKNGDWKEVDTKPAAVPSAIVPERIATYIRTNFPDAAIVAIDRTPRKYEVELSNGLEVKFDIRYNFIGVDD